MRDVMAAIWKAQALFTLHMTCSSSKHPNRRTQVERVELLSAAEPGAMWVWDLDEVRVGHHEHRHGS